MRTPFDRQATAAQPAIGQPIAAEYEAGAVLSGKYRLEALLGEGGMGAVWRATNVHLDLPVAIKLIRAGLDRTALRARLQLEARSAAKLGHPAIVRVYDVGESELGDPFIVMEHLRGETLAQMLNGGRLSAIRAAQLLLPIIDALAMAHGRGIVHRDLKPDNVMIALEDQHVCPKILDFGVAKLTDPRATDHKLTAAGAVVGSPEYMSPEQARGQDDVSASTDIWSMCVVLYETVTGSAPFTAANYNALLRSIVEDEPKPLSEHAAGDDDLWQIIERGLRKDRSQRYANISELGQALAGWLLRNGVTEDACGTSLDVKWFSRGSDPQSSSERSALGNSSEQAATRHESIPDSTGLTRGPFTATIRPVTVRRTRTLGALLMACALLGASWLVLGHFQRQAVPSARATATALPLAAITFGPLSFTDSLQQPSQTTKMPPLEVRPVSSAQPGREHDAKHEAKPAPSMPRSKAAPSPLRSSALGGTVAATTSAAPAAAKSNPPLDLLPPY